MLGISLLLCHEPFTGLEPNVGLFSERLLMNLGKTSIAAVRAMVFPLLWVIFPILGQVDPWLRTSCTKVSQIPFSWFLSVVRKSKLDDLFYVLPLALDAM